MFDDEMIANGVEWILIQAGDIRLCKPFVKFEIEDLEAQRLCGLNFIHISRQPRCVGGGGTDEQSNGFKCCIHGVHHPRFI